MASVVIKVKYQETLRRFNVGVSGDQLLDLSMEDLRVKICSLFNLSVDTKFHLTYEDEDDDLVTLVDDADLHDVVRQGLNPVRITVHLNSVESAQSSAPGGNAPLSTLSPQNVQPNVAEALTHVLLNIGQSIPNLQQRTNSDVASIVKAVQEPLAQALSKLSLDVSSKAASASPTLGNLFDGLSKIGQSYVNAATSNSGSASVSCHSDAGNDCEPNSEGVKHESIKNNDKIGRRDPTKPAPKITKDPEGDLSVKSPSDASFPSGKGKSTCNETSSNKKFSNCGMKNNKDSYAQNKGGFNAGFLGATPINASVKESVRDTAERLRGFQSYRDSMPLGECPFGGIPPTYDQLFNPMHQFNRSLSKADSMGAIFHKGVRCDGCGALPITGPRFKSKVKYDYDLCSICFSRMGNVLDYTRIDFPMTYGHPWSFKTPEAKSLPRCMLRQHAPKHLRSRLDSRFIMDVNVMDGTAMAPQTPFTKIWRMRNNGTLPWDHKLQLLWIGGDRFSPSDSVEIQVPPTGVDVGLELDIAVDFIAPELPGRYISYWRMAEPSGHKFGQRVWVQIQVDPSVDLTRESSSMLNLNLPPDSSDVTFHEVVDVKTEPEFIVEVGESSAKHPVSEQNNIEISSLNFPTNGDLLIDGDVVHPSSAIADRPVSPLEGPISYPKFDVKDAPASSSSMTMDEYLKLAAGCSTEPQLYAETKSEEKLLTELSEMGFKQVDLNKEILRMNEYDLDRSVDDLRDASEWDPILEELKEMGFEDKETNKKLLVKNNGSITRVVMDLIAEEKAE